jgi:hypothetical protein
MYIYELLTLLMMTYHHLIVERRFACPSDLESYAGGSITS